MIISHKYKFIFIKTAKTAGTSIEVFLSQHCSKNDILTPINPPVEPHIARNYMGLWNPLPELLYFKARNIKSVVRHFLKKQKFYNHIPGCIVQQRISEKMWSEYFKFCVERNPWDMTLSHYYMINYRSGGGLTFDEYIEKGNFRSNQYMYTNKAGDLILDRVIKYESLMEQLGEIFDYIGIPFTGTLGVRAKSEYRQERKPYQEIFSDQQRQIIEKVFENEIKMHNYSYYS